MKSSVSTPRYKWGSVNHASVGTVTSISDNWRDIVVDFPQQKHWTGILEEMELVPSVHPDVRCDGCGMNPISGARWV